MTNIDIMQDASEIVHYDNPDIPLYIRIGILSAYPDMKALCHWHEDIELICIIEGEMNYQINGKNILLKETDCLIVNSKQLHYGYSNLHRDCKFVCVLFHSSLLKANPSIYKKYIAPFMENRAIEYLHYAGQSEDCCQIREWIHRILSLKQESGDAYELEIISILYLMYRALFRQQKNVLEQNAPPDNTDLDLQKKMVSYIYEHYQDSLTLNEIAASANISRSKCCIIFKHYLQQSPIEFLNKYRLEVSRYLLTNTHSSVSQIAISCGFNHLSYFSKLFFREYGCTPTKYRKH